MTTILLTTTVFINPRKSYLVQINPQDRINTYLTSIRQWLYKTSFNILLVDNSGYEFNELDTEKKIFRDRFEVVAFKESELKLANYLRNNNSKGASEIFAINYAFYNSQLQHKTTFIIKITGRFFIDELEEYLNNYDLSEYGALTQFEKNRCEMVGSHVKNFWYMFNIILCNDNHRYNPHVESIYECRAEKFNVLTCKVFNISPTQRGGVSEKYTTI